MLQEFGHHVRNIRWGWSLIQGQKKIKTTKKKAKKPAKKVQCMFFFCFFFRKLQFDYRIWYGDTSGNTCKHFGYMNKATGSSTLQEFAFGLLQTRTKPTKSIHSESSSPMLRSCRCFWEKLLNVWLIVLFNYSGTFLKKITFWVVTSSSTARLAQSIPACCDC